jgi:FKBP-type peptidyl-prolyl cis-trans isomerase
MKKYILSGCLAVSMIWFSCKEKSQYPGYSKLEHGIYYQLVKIGKDTVKPRYGDYITTTITYKTLDDSVLFHGRRRFQLTEPKEKGGIEECFLLLSEKDKANYILSADKFFSGTLGTKPPDSLRNKNMKIAVVMEDIQTAQEYQKEKEAFLHWIEDFARYEKTILKQYIEDKGINAQPTSSGLYHIVINKGNDKKVEKYDTLLFHYEGKFLNGKYFDSTKERNDPFRLIYGYEWQVIKGLEEGLGLMREGEKALFILPSELAFGKTGSSSGLIPPCTSLIYEVELIEIRKAD